VQIDRGTVGVVPYAAMGAGRPVVVLAGLSPRVGVAGDGFVRGVLAPVRGLAERRRLIVFNRRPGLALGLSMGELAAEYAEAIVRLGAPVDVVGVSTGGSIAQQLAADHGAVVGRLVLLSTACRLGGVGRQLQSTVAAELRAGRTRRAVSVAAGGIAPKSLRPVARGVGWLAAPRVVTSQSAAADLAVTLEAEDGLDLAKCESRVQAPTLIIARWP
jgi:pimeloyl-ACP methyl ester carboxylesterase